MRAFHALMLLLGSVAVLMSGAAPETALAAGAAPPCHETAAPHDGADGPKSAPDDPMQAMDCCTAWAAAPTLRRPEVVRPVSLRPVAAMRPVALPPGERPAPEPRPPRTSRL